MLSDKRQIDHGIVPEFLRNTDHGHIEGVLDEEPPWIIRSLISILWSNVRVGEDAAQKIRDAKRTGPVVYAMKYRSVFDLHFLRMRFANLGLPLPAFVFETAAAETGSLFSALKVWRARLTGMLSDRKWSPSFRDDVLRDILVNGGAGVLFLVDEKTSSDRYVHPERDPIRILLELQGRVPGSIAVVPMMILFDRTPRPAIRPFWESLLGDPDKPGPLKRIHNALRKWIVPELLVGEPVHLLGQFEEFGSERSWEDLPFEVRKDLIASINERIRINRGPEKLSRTEIKERVLQDHEVRQAVQEMVVEEDIPEHKVRRKAEAYVDEIAADQRIALHNFWVHVLKWAFKKVFSAVDLKEAEYTRMKKANADGSLILVACHKSHFDYLLIGYHSFVNQMAIPHIAAGKNLAFWPMGPMMRYTGAFFLRRSFKGLRLYPQVFAAYMKVLVKEKVNINFYIEGGRSRTGKYLPPKTGLLTFLLKAVEEGAVKDLAFVPTFVGYDRVPEESSYLRELGGREKSKESVLEMIRARSILSQRFGRAYVRYHPPVSFRGFLDRWQTNRSSAESVTDAPDLAKDFAYHIMCGIVRAGVVTPSELVAAGLVCSGQTLVSRVAVFDAIDRFSSVIRAQGIEFAESIENNPSQALETALEMVCARGFAETESPPEASIGEKKYVINGPARTTLQFYKNALVNYLWPASLYATVRLMHATDDHTITQPMREDFISLFQLLSGELIFDPLIPADELLMKTHVWFGEKGWLGRGADLDRSLFEDLRGMLADLLELYYVVLCGAQAGVNLSLRELLKILVKTAEDVRSGTNCGTIALPVVTVRNALSRFSEMGILDYAHSKKMLNAVRNHDEMLRLRVFLCRALCGRVSDPGTVSAIERLVS